MTGRIGYYDFIILKEGGAKVSLTFYAKDYTLPEAIKEAKKQMK